MYQLFADSYSVVRKISPDWLGRSCLRCHMAQVSQAKNNCWDILHSFQHLCCWSPVAGVTLKLGTWGSKSVPLHKSWKSYSWGWDQRFSRKYAAICCTLIDMRTVNPHCGQPSANCTQLSVIIAWKGVKQLHCRAHEIAKLREGGVELRYGAGWEAAP